MVAWIALVVAVITSILLIIHAALPDNSNGSIAHGVNGTFSEWLRTSFPYPPRTSAPTSAPSQPLQYRPDVRGHAITPTESFLANIALDARGIGLEGSQS